MNILNKYGIREDYFDLIDREAESNKHTHELCQWIKNNGQSPNKRSKDKNEKFLGLFLTNRKASKRSNTGSIWYSSDQIIANSYDLNDLFISRDDSWVEKESNKRTNELCQWIISNKRNPLSNSENKQEDSLNGFLGSRRKAKKYNDNFYKSDEKIAVSYGLNDLFNHMNTESSSNKKAHDLCKWMKNNGVTPDAKSKDEIERKMAMFISSCRQAKKNPKRIKWYKSNERIAKSYGYNDIFNGVDFEKNSNDNTRKLCQWIKINGREPLFTEKNKEEFKQAQFLSLRRQANDKNNHKTLTWYPSDAKIATSYGFDGLFNKSTFEQRSNKKTTLVCQFVKKYNKNPSSKSKNEQERLLGEFLSSKKDALMGSGTSVFFRSDKTIADSYGLTNLFQKFDLEAISNKKTELLCEWIIKNKRSPKENSKDKVESAFCHFLCRKRSARSGGVDSVFYKSDQKILYKYKMNNLFNKINREDISNDKTSILCEWIKINGFPSYSYKNQEEKNMLMILRGKKKRHHKSDVKIAESHGFKDLFCKENPELVSNGKVTAICEFKKKFGRNPSVLDKNKDYKALGTYLTNRRGLYNKSRPGTWYDSDLKIAKSHGFSDLFEDDREKLSNQKVHELCKFIKINGRNPNSHSKDKSEKYLGRFLGTKRGSKKGLEGKFYDSDQGIAQSYGFKNLFN